MSNTFRVEIKTETGWTPVAGMTGLREHEAHALAAKHYSEPYWAALMGGEERVRVVTELEEAA